MATHRTARTRPDRSPRARGAVTALAGVVGLCTGLVFAAQAEPGAAVNPVRPVSTTDPDADPSHHFLVLVEGDAGLYQNESEGAVLVGGALKWRGYQVTPMSAPYTVPGDEAPAGLVVLGALNFAGSAGGHRILTVQQNTNGYFGDLGSATVVPGGGVTYVVPRGGGAGTRPAVEVHRAQTAASMSLDPGFDVPSLFASYRTLAAEIARCPTTVALLGQNGSGPWPGGGPATIRLAPGQNVLNTTAADLTALSNLNLTGDSTQLGAATLVVNVADTGDHDWPVPELDFQGTSNASHILWNLASTGTVTLPPAEGDAVWGTVYAPNARLVDHATANIEGNVVVRELEHGGTEEDGGEIHDTPFRGTVTPCGEPQSPTTTTTGTTTTGPTTTGPTTTGPLPTTAPTTPAPATTTGGPGGGSHWPANGGTALPSTGFPGTPWAIGGAALTTTGCVLLAVAAIRRRTPTR